MRLVAAEGLGEMEFCLPGCRVCRGFRRIEVMDPRIGRVRVANQGVGRAKGSDETDSWI